MSDFKVVQLLNPIQLNFTGPNFQGVYSNSQTYQPGMSVSFAGSSWVALQETTGNLPTDAAYWQLLAQKGDAGAGSVSYTARNQTGSLIPKGSVVYISGASGNRPLISLALADTDATSSKVFGITSQDIPDNNNGTVIAMGDLTTVNTNAFPAGSSLWLSPTVPGGITSTRPVPPDHAVFLGFCIVQSATVGEITVNVINGFELEELHNVKFTGLVDKQLIRYNSVTKIWENHTPTKSDVGLGDVPNVDATNPANITQSASYRFVTDTEKSTWNGKQDALGFTPENVANKSDNTSLGTSSTLYPTQNAVKSYVDSKIVSDADKFEKVSKNLRSFPQTIAYSAGKVSSITYQTGPSTSIIKSFNYSGSLISTIVLSGDLPIELGSITTKNLTYSGSQLVGVSYS